MNVNRVLFFKSNDSQKQYSSNKPGNFTTKLIPAFKIWRIIPNTLSHWIISQWQQVDII